MNRMIQYFGTDRKRIHHAMKVFAFSCALWSEEARDKGFSSNDPRRTTLLLAAALHDIGILEAQRKHGSCEGKYQEEEGPAIAEKILRECKADEETIRRVCFLVGHHHTYAAIDDVDFLILVEADLLVNLDEDNLPADAVRSARDKWMKTAGSREILHSYLSGKPDKE